MLEVSVIVPVFNTSQEYLKQCLNSIFAQRFCSFEVIVVDDGSDRSEALESTFRSFETNNNFRLIRHEVNKGLPSARNTGLTNAVGKYVVFVDSDDFWVGDNVLHELHTTALIDGCDVLRFNGKYYSGSRFGANLAPHDDFINISARASPRCRIFRSVFLYFIKRSFLLDKSIVFNQGIHIGEDVFFLSKVLAETDKVSSVSNFFYAYRYDNESMMRSRWRLAQFEEEACSALAVLEHFNDSSAVLREYFNNRYNSYLLIGLLPRVATDLSGSEQRIIANQYLSTVKKLSEHLGGDFKIGRLTKILLLLAKCRMLSPKFSLIRPVLKFAFPKLKRIAKMYTSTFWANQINRVMRRLSLRVDSVGLKGIFQRPLLNNLEGRIDYSIEKPSQIHIKPGVSAMIRVKNEERLIWACLKSISSHFDELVVIDNGSTDKTVAVVKRFADTHDDGHKVRLYTYPFLVSKCGEDHNNTPENSVHSLAYYYNWCKSKCRYRAIVKWDADMVMGGQIDVFRKVVRTINNSKINVGAIFKTQSVYVHDNEPLLVGNLLFSEVRAFTNSPNVYFTKDNNFERLTFTSLHRIVECSAIFSFELKDTQEDEFDHWSSMSFDGPRKVSEYRTYRALQLGYLDRTADFQPFNLSSS
jgi:glycosyltransferase involved in cell wall biosynthesis